MTMADQSKVHGNTGLTYKRLRASDGIDIRCVGSDLEILREIRNNRSRLLSTAAEQCGISLEKLRGESRDTDIACRRWRVEYLLRELGYSYPVIGKMINKDHSTVMYGVRKVADAIAAAQGEQVAA